MLNHRFIREARGTQNLVHLIKRYEGWVALGEEEPFEDQPQEQDEYSPKSDHPNLVQTNNGMRRGISVLYVPRTVITLEFVVTQQGMHPEQ